MEMKTVRGKVIKELVRDFEGTVAQGKDAKDIYNEILAMVAKMENEILKYDEMEEKLGDIRVLQHKVDVLKKAKRVFADIHLEKCLQFADDFQNLLPTLLKAIKENELPVNVVCDGIEYTYDGNYYLCEIAYYGEVIVYLGDYEERYYFVDKRYDIDDDIERLERELAEAMSELDSRKTTIWNSCSQML